MSINRNATLCVYGRDQEVVDVIEEPSTNWNCSQSTNPRSIKVSTIEKCDDGNVISMEKIRPAREYPIPEAQPYSSRQADRRVQRASSVCRLSGSLSPIGLNPVPRQWGG